MSSSPLGNYIMKIEMGRAFSIDDMIAFGKALSEKDDVEDKVKAQFQKSSDSMDDRIVQNYGYILRAQKYIKDHPPTDKSVAPPKLEKVSLAILLDREQEKEQG